MVFHVNSFVHLYTQEISAHARGSMVISNSLVVPLSTVLAYRHCFYLLWVLIEFLKHVSRRVGAHDNCAGKYLSHKLDPVDELTPRAGTKDYLPPVNTVIECYVVDENYDEMAQGKASAYANNAPRIGFK